MEAVAPLTNRETLRLLLRVFGYLRNLKALMAIKAVFAFLSHMPVLLVVWPAKVLADQVIQGIALADSPTRYPFFFEPLVLSVQHEGPMTIAMTMLMFTAITLLIFGAWSSIGRDMAIERLSQGNDAATRTEYQANYAYSYCGGILGWLEFRLTLKLTQAFNHTFRSHLFRRLQRLPMTSLDNQRIGDAIYRVMYDTPMISEVVYKGVLVPLVAPLEIAMILWVLSMSYGDFPVIINVVLAWVPVAFLVTLPLAGKVRRQAEAARESGALTTTTMEEASTNILAVQSLGAQGLERDRFDTDSWSSFREYLNWRLLNIAVNLISWTGGIGLGVFVYFELTDLVFAGKLTVGDLGAISALYITALFASARLGRMWIELQTNVSGLRRVFAIIDLPSDDQPRGARRLDSIEEGYRFEDVSFQYPDGTQALSGINFTAKRGQMVALVGPAGAGKTTLAYMLPRFVKPSSGRVLLDGVDLAEIDRDDLRRNVSFVFQEPVLIDDTIAGNIRVAKPDATEEEMRDSASAGGALEFIERLPLGFDTPLGRNGARLSVGQKQRLAITRALVRKAPVLVLDEPTAALDPETEHELMRTVSKLAADSLVVVIAHRLSTIRHADQILFIEDGRIRESGTHEQLVQRQGGAYRRFVELQTGATD